MIPIGVKDKFVSSCMQEAVVTNIRKLSRTVAAYELTIGFVSSGGKANKMLMYAYGEWAFRIRAEQLKEGDCALFFFVLDNYRGEGFVGVRGVMRDFRYLGKEVRTKQYLSEQFEKSVTNKLNSDEYQH